MFKKRPIITCCEGGEEITSPFQFAEHAPGVFKNVDYIKNQGIHRAYIIFYDNPENNEFLSKLNIVWEYHAGSTNTKVFEYKNALIAISCLGGPAAANLMEELRVFGIDEFIAIGTAGCLEDSIKDKIVIVDKAIRDEGLSYHYLKPSTYVHTNDCLNQEIVNYLTLKKLDFIKSTTWTTDAYYRETTRKINMVKKLGAVAVEMECASWAAVAKYRKLKFSQMLYFSDIVKQEAWSRITKYTDGYESKNQDIVISIIKGMIDEYSK